MATENLETAHRSKVSGAPEAPLLSEMKDLKAKVQVGKAVIGKEQTLKCLRTESLQKVYLAKNCPESLKADVYHYAKLVNTPVVELELDNEELGLFCKKNFFISVLGTTE